MKRFLIAASAIAIMAGSAGAAAAQPRHDDRRDDHRPSAHAQVTHHNWRQGQRLSSNDWRRGQRVDYRSHHLRAPPRGYEWRRIDNDYVLAAVATGLIASILSAN